MAALLASSALASALLPGPALSAPAQAAAPDKSAPDRPAPHKPLPDKPAWAQALDQAAQDEPRAAITLARARLQATPEGLDRFWALLALARALSLLEQSAEAAATVAQAETVLADSPGNTPAQRLWLDLAALQVGWTLDEPAQAQARLKALQLRLPADADPALVCDMTEMAMVLLIDIDSLDEAWLAAEALERCGRDIGAVDKESTGIMSLGLLTRKGHGASPGEADIYF